MTFVNHIRSFIRAAVIHAGGKAHIVGQSLDGMVAFRLPDRVPELADHIVIQGQTFSGGRD